MIQAVGDLVLILRHHFNYLILTATLQVPPLSSWATDASRGTDLPKVTQRQDSTQSL